jgi:hypothetical protein
MESLEPLAGVANSRHFSVRSRIIRRSHVIPASPENFAASHHHGTERPAVVAPHFLN